MNRMTTDSPEGNYSTALNMFYTKDMMTWVRGGGPAPDYPDIPLTAYMRNIIEKHCLDIEHECDGDLGDAMYELLYDGTDTMEGVIATFYTAAWVASELRAHLKQYEDTGITPHDLDGIDPERLREIISAEKSGRVVIKPEPLTDTCGSCKHFQREKGKASGICDCRTDSRRGWGFTNTALYVTQSRKRCRDDYEKKEEHTG